MSPYTTNPRRKGGRHKHHAGSSQLSSLNISNNKFAMMTHAISDPIPEQQTTHSPSAITSVPPTPNSYIEIQQENGKCMNSQFYSPNYVHPPPLENRNSAPEIVVLSPGRELPQIPIHQEKPSKKSYNTHGVEDRINRAKAKVLQSICQDSLSMSGKACPCRLLMMLALLSVCVSIYLMCRSYP